MIIKNSEILFFSFSSINFYPRFLNPVSYFFVYLLSQSYSNQMKKIGNKPSINNNHREQFENNSRTIREQYELLSVHVRFNSSVVVSE